MKIYSFPQGGLWFEDPTAPVLPATGKVPDSNGRVVIAFLPVISVIPMIQHGGVQAVPVVSVGDTVREAMLIGRAQGAGSVNIHATVPGKVIREVSWDFAEGIRNTALVIRMGGTFDILGKREIPHAWEALLPYDLQRLIVEYGIVEMEGSGRSMADLFFSLRDIPTPLTLVVRCVFDDPWLAADKALCAECPGAVAEGSMIMARAIRANRVVYAVSQKDEALGSRLLAQGGNLPASMMLVKAKYPQKNRRELELVLGEYEKAEGLDSGSPLILGPATLAAIHDAVKLRKPILDRYVAVGGSEVRKPQVILARIGTRLSELFEQCGGLMSEPRRMVMGSPLAGRRITELDEPVTKTSYAVVAMRDKQIGGTAIRSCINCGACRAVCPVGLDPEVLFKRIREGLLDEENTGRAVQCHGCGCCNLVCPSRIPLRNIILTAVREINHDRI
jgi:electron transport complex protein RnfC